VNLSRAWLTWTDGRQAASADRLRAGIEGSGGGGQTKIAVSRHEGGRTGGQVQAIPPQSDVTACIPKTVQDRDIVALED